MGIQTTESKGLTKKKYRLGYDYLFLPKETITYKNDLIGDMSITVLFKLYDEKGNEKLFESEKMGDQSISLKNGERCYLSDFINCVFDREKIFEFELNPLFIKHLEGSLSWEVVHFEKGIMKSRFSVDSKEISKEEFMDIMRKHLDFFDVKDNYPAQTTSYITREVK